MNSMHKYCVCGLILASSIPLPELNSATDLVVECEFLLMPSGPFSPSKCEWFHQWQSEGSEGEGEKDPWVCFARHDQGYILRFPSCGDFFISRDMSEIRCRPLPNIPVVTVRHLLLDQVIPLVLSRKERVVLHASAVSTERGVIAFAGKSGRGKSTMALAFALEGHELVADDCLALRCEAGNWTVLPSYPGARLWESTAEKLIPRYVSTTDVAHYTSKRRIVETYGLQFSTRPQPIRSLYVLGEERPEISIEKLTASRAFMAWAEFAYNLDIEDADFLRGHFGTVGVLATKVPAYALNHPREYTMLPSVRAAILEHLKEVDNETE